MILVLEHPALADVRRLYSHQIVDAQRLAALGKMPVGPAQALANSGCPRRAAMSSASAAIPAKVSIKAKRLKAAWSEEYLATALTHMR